VQNEFEKKGYASPKKEWGGGGGGGRFTHQQSRVQSSPCESSIILVLFEEQGRDRSVGTATGYRLDDSGIESRWGQDYPHSSRPAHSASYTMSTGSLPGVKRPGCGVDHPHHLAPRLKKE